jgi:hypothetical protein
MKPLSFTQSWLLGKIGTDWGPLPASVHITNRTLAALEKRGLVETRTIRGRLFALEARRLPT